MPVDINSNYYCSYYYYYYYYYYYFYFSDTTKTSTVTYSLSLWRVLLERIFPVPSIGVVEVAVVAEVRVSSLSAVLLAPTATAAAARLMELLLFRCVFLLFLLAEGRVLRPDFSSAVELYLCMILTW